MPELENNFEPSFFTSILDTVSDELQEPSSFKLQNAVNFEIITSAQINKHETLAHAVWAFKHELI